MLCEEVSGIGAVMERYPNLPEYVIKDMFRGDADDKLFKQLNRLAWKLEVIDVSIEDFAPEVQEKLQQRQFGKANPGNVPNDGERMEFQMKVAQETPPGENEPIIVVKAVDGYRLWEGWHRVMSLLRPGKRTRIRAWVGSK